MSIKLVILTHGLANYLDHPFEKRHVEFKNYREINIIGKTLRLVRGCVRSKFLIIDKLYHAYSHSLDVFNTPTQSNTTEKNVGKEVLRGLVNMNVGGPGIIPEYGVVFVEAVMLYAWLSSSVNANRY